MKCNVEVKTRINPTEDLDKIINAISKIFSYDELEIGDDYVLISGGCESLQNLKDLFQKRRIRGAARKIITNGTGEDCIKFKLSKQAAFSGVANLLDEEETFPLGELEVKIKAEDVDLFIDWMAPQV